MNIRIFVANDYFISMLILASASVDSPLCPQYVYLDHSRIAWPVSLEVIASHNIMDSSFSS